MTFTELVEYVSSKTGHPREEVNGILRHTITAIETEAKAGESIQLPGLGKFTKKVSKPRMAFGKMTAEKTTIKFTPYASIAEKHK